MPCIMDVTPAHAQPLDFTQLLEGLPRDKAELVKRLQILICDHQALVSNHQALVTAVQEVMADRDRLKARVLELEAVNKRLTDMAWGRRSERRSIDPSQLLLPNSESWTEPNDAEVPGVILAGDAAQEVIDAELIKNWEQRRQQRKSQPRREEFPAHFERRERVLDLPEDQKIGLTYIGDAVTERLVVLATRFYVDRIVRPKYIRPGKPEEGVKAVPAPVAIVEGCRYDFSVIATILTSKFAFHLPTYRQQDEFAQGGWFPSRSTMNDLINHSVDTVDPLIHQLWHEVLRPQVVLVDETRVRLLTRDSLTKEQHGQLADRLKAAAKSSGEEDIPESNDGGSVTSYAWLIMGQDEQAPYNLFHWSLTRQQTTIDELLKNFHGTVVADAYGAYAHIATRSSGRITHASCNVHARREFTVCEKYEPLLCAQLESLYSQLYAIEERGKSLRAGERLTLRQREAVPIWSRLEQWLQSDAVVRAALPRSPFGKAVGYLRNQWKALRMYLGDGSLPMDNNQCERTIRPLTVGRRNWLFLGHPQAAPGRMRLLSLVSSAHRHNLVIKDYLVDVLSRLADARQNHPQDLQLDSALLKELLPDRWGAAHPESVRHGRVQEKQDRAHAKQAGRALQRQQARVERANTQ